MWPPQKSELAGKRPRILVVGGQSLKSKEHSEVEKTHLLLASWRAEGMLPCSTFVWGRK